MNLRKKYWPLTNEMKKKCGFQLRSGPSHGTEGHPQGWTEVLALLVTTRQPLEPQGRWIIRGRHTHAHTGTHFCATLE